MNGQSEKYVKINKYNNKEGKKKNLIFFSFLFSLSLPVTHNSPSEFVFSSLP